MPAGCLRPEIKVSVYMEIKAMNEGKPLSLGEILEQALGPDNRTLLGHKTRGRALGITRQGRGRSPGMPALK